MTFEVEPHGSDRLIDLQAVPDRAEELKKISGSFPSVTLSQRQLCDLELLMNGAFTPLTGFMGQAAYESVLDSLSLPDGTLWPVPVVLDVTAQMAEKLSVGDRLALRDSEGFMPAVLTVEDIWQPDRRNEAERVYGTADVSHPGVRYLLDKVNPVCVGGRVEGVQAPMHHDFENLWDTPLEMRSLFSRSGWRRRGSRVPAAPWPRRRSRRTWRCAGSGSRGPLSVCRR